ncbi:MAG: IS256 family transposase [Candidatus Aminicenantaceae bacterium]
MKENSMQEMAKDAIKETVEKVVGGRDEMKGFIHSSLQELLEELVNKLMITERDLFQKSNHDFGNGYYPRSMQTSLGKLSLDIPRTRNFNFRPFMLNTPYKRTEESYDRLLEALITNGYSPSSLKAVLSAYGLNYSPKEVDTITDELKTRYYEFIEKEISEEVFVLYIDGYRCEMKEKEKVQTVTIYTVIGINCEWKKTLYGFYVHKGVEKKAGWLEIFNDLISRGLKKVSLIVSDDFSGLKEAVSELFPQTDHQLCLTHFKRNITRNMSKEDAKTFKEKFTNLKISNNLDVAVNDFETLIVDYKEKYKNFMSSVWLKRRNYLTFIKYPESVQKYIYTTNTSENFNSLIEKIRGRMGGFFQSQDVLGINIILQLNRLKKGKWKKPIPHFKSNEYELLQMHRLKFRNHEQSEDMELKKAEKEMRKASLNYRKNNSNALETRI